MASSQEKYQLVLEAREAAAAKIKKLNKQINALGGPAMVKSQREIKKLERQLKTLNTTAGSGPKVFTRFTKGIAIGTVTAQAAIKAFDILATTIKRGIDSSIENIGSYQANMKAMQSVSASTGRPINQVIAAMNTQLGGLANKAQVASGFLKGLTTTLTVDQINQLTTAVKDASIAMGEDFGTQLPMIIKAIKQLNPNILDNIGVTVRLDQVNKKIREGYYGMGTAITETTQQHAIFTEIMRQTAKFAGLENEHLKTMKGSFAAVKAAVENIIITFGDAAIQTTIFKDFLTLLRDAASYWSNAFGANQIGSIESVRSQIESTKSELDKYNQLQKEIDETPWYDRLLTAGGDYSVMIDELKKKLAELRYQEQLLSDKTLKQMEQEKAEKRAAVAAMFEGLKDIKLPTPALMDEEEAAVKAQELHERLSAAIQEVALTEGALIPAEGGLLPELSEVETLGSDLNAAIKSQVNADIIKGQQQQFVSAFGAIGQRGVANLSRAIASGRGDIGDVFKGMHEDFMALFIQQSIAAIADMFIPGLGRLLGGMFDTPRYDRMAMEQGEHFAHYFAQGVFKSMRSGSEFMRGIVPSAGNLAMPALATAAPAAASPGNTINVTFSGNVLSSDFIEKQVAPTLRKLTTNGKTDLALDPENLTGRRNVRIY